MRQPNVTRFDVLVMGVCGALIALAERAWRWEHRRWPFT